MSPTNHTKGVDIPLDVLQEILGAPHRYFLWHSPAVLQKGEQTFENFTCIWNIETIRSSNLCSRFQSLSETELIKNCRLSSLFKKRTSWYMTRNSWELKLNSTILTHSKSKLMLIVSILMVNLWIWIIILYLWYFVTYGLAFVVVILVVHRGFICNL